MSKTPSHRRRDGRNAFDPNTLPSTVNPYIPYKSFGGKGHSDDWMEGWNEEEKEYLENLEKVEEPEPLEAIKEAIRVYHTALSNREHGGVAAGRCINRIEDILDMHQEG